MGVQFFVMINDLKRLLFALAGDETCSNILAMWLTQIDLLGLPSTYFSTVHGETIDTFLLVSFLTEEKERSPYKPFINTFAPAHVIPNL